MKYFSEYGNYLGTGTEVFESNESLVSLQTQAYEKAREMAESYEGMYGFMDKDCYEEDGYS